MRGWLIDYNARLKDAENADSLEDLGGWELLRPGLSFSLWKLGEQFGWQMPLFDGGLANWPEWFLHDFSILQWQNRMIRRDMGFKR